MINKKLISYWLITFLFSSYFLTFKDFHSESNDSNYYTQLVFRYHDLGWQEILTPKWGENCYGFDKNSYMRDQLPGQTLMGIALTKLHIPASQALYIAEMAFQILSILLFASIALHFSAYDSASVLLYSLLITPLAFSYNLRANHETGIMFFSLLALYAGLKLPRSWKWVLTSSLACLFLLWIKGPFFIFGFLLMSIGYFFSMEKEKRISFLISAYFLSGALIVLSAFSFEWITRKLTGESFFLAFWNIQIQQRALSLAHKYPFVIQKIINFYYYFSHYLAYALPWSFFLIIILVKKVRVSTTFKTCSQFIKSPLSLCILTSAMSFCLLFSLSDRTAGRYTFPGYYMFAAWTILFLYDQSSLFKRFHQSIMKLGLHYVVPGLWLLAFGLHFIKKS